MEKNYKAILLNCFIKFNILFNNKSSLFLLPIFFLLFVIIEQVHYLVQNLQLLRYFQNAESLTDHKIFFTVNGFISNGNVHWEFINLNKIYISMVVLKLMNLVILWNLLLLMRSNQTLLDLLMTKIIIF